MAEAYDKKVFRTIALAAREAHPITASPGPEPGGTTIELGVTKEYNAQALVDAFFEAAAVLDEKISQKLDVLRYLTQDNTMPWYHRFLLTS